MSLVKISKELSEKQKNLVTLFTDETDEIQDKTPLTASLKRKRSEDDFSDDDEEDADELSVETKKQKENEKLDILYIVNPTLAEERSQLDPGKKFYVDEDHMKYIQLNGSVEWIKKLQGWVNEADKVIQEKTSGETKKSFRWYMADAFNEVWEDYENKDKENWKPYTVSINEFFDELATELPKDVLLFEGQGKYEKDFEKEDLKEGLVIKRKRCTSASWRFGSAQAFAPSDSIDTLPYQDLKTGVLLIHRIADDGIKAAMLESIARVMGQWECEIMLQPGIKITVKDVKRRQLINNYSQYRIASLLGKHYYDVVYTEVTRI